jgi:flagellar assembly factor FliW
MTAVLPAAVPAPAVAVQAIRLAEPLPGIPGHRDYVLVPAEATGLLCWLQALAPDGPRFLVVPPAPYVPGYAPRLPASVLGELGLERAADARLYCVVTVPGGDVQAATANLRAPLVVNAESGRARQVVLTDGGFPIKHPLRR